MSKLGKVILLIWGIVALIGVIILAVVVHESILKKERRRLVHYARSQSWGRDQGEDYSGEIRRQRLVMEDQLDEMEEQTEELRRQNLQMMEIQMQLDEQEFNADMDRIMKQHGIPIY